MMSAAIERCGSEGEVQGLLELGALDALKAHFCFLNVFWIIFSPQNLFLYSSKACF